MRDPEIVASFNKLLDQTPPQDGVAPKVGGDVSALVGEHAGGLLGLASGLSVLLRKGAALVSEGRYAEPAVLGLYGCETPGAPGGVSGYEIAVVRAEACSSGERGRQASAA